MQFQLRIAAGNGLAPAAKNREKRRVRGVGCTQGGGKYGVGLWAPMSAGRPASGLPQPWYGGLHCHLAPARLATSASERGFHQYARRFKAAQATNLEPGAEAPALAAASLASSYAPRAAEEGVGGSRRAYCGLVRFGGEPRRRGRSSIEETGGRGSDGRAALVRRYSGGSKELPACCKRGRRMGVKG